MATERHDRLSVGVVGLGRLWEARHRPALSRLGNRFRVAGVFDQVAWRAAVEADALRCAAAESLTALIERPDIEAIYLLAPQWFGSHAAELAAAAGKAIYYGLPVAADPAGLEAIAALVAQSGARFVPELARRFYPATLRLRELLATVLGPPRLILGHVRLFGYDRYGTPGPSTQLAPVAMAVDPGGNLLDWCRWLFQAEPTALTAFGAAVLPAETEPASAPGNDFEGFALEFAGGGLAQISFARYHRSAWGEATRFLPHPGFQVFTERGAAWVEMPDHIHWIEGASAAASPHEERLPLEPSIGELLNEQFYRAVRGQESLAPTLDDARAAARLVQAYQRSRQEGRRIPIEPAEHG